MYPNRYNRTNYSEFILPAGIIIGLFYFGNKVFGNPSDKTGETITDAEKEVKKSELTYSVSWYSQAADTIAENLETAKKWTSKVYDPNRNNAIKAVVTRLNALKNKSDWLLLVAKFGKRRALGHALITESSLPKWLIMFLDDLEYYFEKDGKRKTANALEMARAVLRKINVSL